MIKIINGTYGFRNPKTGRVEARNSKSEPFDLNNPKREEELVSQGVAEYVDQAPQSPDGDPGDDQNIDQDLLPKYNVKMTVAQLIEIAGKYGVEVPDGTTKAEIVKMIDEKLADVEDDDQGEHETQDGDQDDDQDAAAPDLSAQMPE